MSSPLLALHCQVPSHWSTTQPSEPSTLPGQAGPSSEVWVPWACQLRWPPTLSWEPSLVRPVTPAPHPPHPSLAARGAKPLNHLSSSPSRVVASCRGPWTRSCYLPPLLHRLPSLFQPTHSAQPQRQPHTGPHAGQEQPRSGERYGSVGWSR